MHLGELHERMSTVMWNYDHLLNSTKTWHLGKQSCTYCFLNNDGCKQPECRGAQDKKTAIERRDMDTESPNSYFFHCSSWVNTHTCDWVQRSGASRTKLVPRLRRGDSWGHVSQLFPESLAAVLGHDAPWSASILVGSPDSCFPSSTLLKVGFKP